MKTVTTAEKQKIRDDIFTETQQAFEKAGFTPQRIAEEAALIAFSDLADHVEIDDGGAIIAKPFSEMKKKSRCVKSVKEKTTIKEADNGKVLFKNSQVEYELYPKLEALKFGATVTGMLIERHEVGVTKELGELLEAARKRVNGKAKRKN